MHEATDIDVSLEQIRAAAELIEGITRGALLCQAERKLGLHLSVWRVGRDSFNFCFEGPFEDAMRRTPWAIRYVENFQEDGMKFFTWSGPWTRDNRPCWQPEAVAGLVLAAVGSWLLPWDVERL